MDIENRTLKATRYEIDQLLNRYIGNLKVDGLSSEAKLALVKLKIEMTDIVKEIDEFRQKTIDSIQKPDNYDKLKEAASKEGATEEDKKVFAEAEARYNNAFAEIALPYFNEVVELPFDYITKEDFYTLVKNNDVNVIFGYEYVYNKLVKGE